MLVQKEYKRRHDNLARIIHYSTCGKYKLMRAENWFEHQPQGVIEFEEVKLLWNFNIQCEKVKERRSPDIVIVEKGERICKIIDVAVPNDSRVNAKEQEKNRKISRITMRRCKVTENEEGPSDFGGGRSIGNNYKQDNCD